MIARPFRSLAMAVCLAAGFAVGCGGVAPQVRVAGDKTPLGETATPLASGRASTARVSPNTFAAQCEGFTSVAAKQRTDVWCWAACAEMIHAYKGTPMSQEEIAARIHGAGDPDAPEAERAKAARAATYDEIIRALVPELPPQAAREATTALDAVFSGQSLEIDASGYLGSQIQRRTVNSDILVDDLLHGEPLVVGLRFPRNSETQPDAASASSGGQPVMGHAYVVYGVDFSRRDTGVLEGAGRGVSDTTKGVFRKLGISDESEYAEWLGRVPYKYDLRSVRLLDPWVGSPVSMDAAEFAQRVDFMISGREARAILEKEKILQPAD